MEPVKLKSNYDHDMAIRRVLPEYIHGLSRHVSELSAALAAGRLDGMQRLVHQLKGSGGSYGFPDITRLASAAEALIIAESGIETIAASVQELCALIRSVDGYDTAGEAHVAQIDAVAIPVSSRGTSSALHEPGPIGPAAIFRGNNVIPCAAKVDAPYGAAAG